MGSWFRIIGQHISFGCYGAILKGHMLMLSIRSDSIDIEFYN
jgi:hypothetical protein